jgi:hypothetical protein
LVSGFSTFAINDSSATTYQVKYTVRIGDSIVLNVDDFPAPPFEDTYYCRIYFPEPIEVPAESKFDIMVSVHPPGDGSVYTYYGSNGDSYDSVESNLHKGLFRMEASSYSSNGTGTYSGFFPELFYYLG